MDRYIQYMYSYPHKTAYRPLQNVDLRDYSGSLGGKGHSLYLHIPFCESKCGYCNLFSVTGCNKRQTDSYLDAVLRQIRQYREILPEDCGFGDFTIGGGTPLLLEEEQLIRVFEAVRGSMPLSEDTKIIIETAPNQTSQKKARLLRQLGVTRVSMGIQSFCDTELVWLKRNHNSSHADTAAGVLTDMGFDCVNFDFIYGLPGQTEETLLASLKRAVSFSPDELFCYPLYIKHGVTLEREHQDARLKSDHTYRLYQCGTAFLKENGYKQVSMRRFLKKNTEALQAEFSECGFTGALSLGCGGRSYLGRLHTCTPYQTTRQAAFGELENYQKTADFLSAAHGILLSDAELKRRYVIKHLLILPGISKQAYRTAFASEVTEDFPVITTWIGQGWLKENTEFIGLTEEGLGLSDFIGPQLISEDIRRKMLEWESVHGQKNNSLQGKLEKLQL
ncbi:MAG: coproporphyrinogen III oxidase family protein [Lachnospiraceae bacterium]|nr:coproporphyrinogen III oxidase family protein [Lachnospiraceae bacterium]